MIWAGVNNQEMMGDYAEWEKEAMKNSVHLAASYMPSSSPCFAFTSCIDHHQKLGAGMKASHWRPILAMSAATIHNPGQRFVRMQVDIVMHARYLGACMQYGLT